MAKCTYYTSRAAVLAAKVAVWLHVRAAFTPAEDVKLWSFGFCFFFLVGWLAVV